MAQVNDNLMTQQHWDLLNQIEPQEGRDLTEAEIDAILASGDPQTIIADNSEKTRKACQNTQSTYSRIKKRLAKPAAITLTSALAFNVIPQLETLEGILSTKPAVQTIQAAEKDEYMISQQIQHIRNNYGHIFDNSNFRFIDDDNFKINVSGSTWIGRKRAKINEDNETIRQAYDVAVYYSENLRGANAADLFLSIFGWQMANGEIRSLEPIKRIVDMNGDSTDNIERALKNNPYFADSAEAKAFLAYKYAKRNNPILSDKYAQQAITQGSNNEEVYATLGNIYWRKDSIDASRSVFEEGIRRLPQSEKLHNGLSRVYERLGLKDLARQEVLKCLGFNPNDENYKTFLNELNNN